MYHTKNENINNENRNNENINNENRNIEKILIDLVKNFDVNIQISGGEYNCMQYPFFCKDYNSTNLNNYVINRKRKHSLIDSDEDMNCNIQDTIVNDIEQNIQDDIEENIQDDIQYDIQDDIEENIQDDIQDDTVNDIEEDNEEKKLNIILNNHPYNCLQQLLKNFYKYINVYDKEIYINEWKFLSLNNTLERINDFNQKNNIYVIDLAIKYHGMGWVYVLFYDPKIKKYKIRFDGGSNGFDRQSNENNLIEYCKHNSKSKCLNNFIDPHYNYFSFDDFCYFLYNINNI